MTPAARVVAWVGTGLSVATMAVAAGPIAPGASAKPGKVEAQLIADSAPRSEGRPVRVGLRMKMDAGWHTYWKNPGDAGMPTRIAWTLPPGWSAGDIDWPAPERIPVGQLASYGYANEVVLPVMLFAPRGWAGSPTAHVEAKAEWLVCKESCLPESAVLAIDLDARASGDARVAQALFAAARARQPRAMAWTRATASRGNGADGRLELMLAPATPGEFFPEREELVEPGDAPRVSADGGAVRWSAKLGAKGRQLAVGTPIRGVWAARSGEAFLVDVPLGR